MANYSMSTEQIGMLMDRVIDRFLEYQYRFGYEEPRARAEAVRDVLDALAMVENQRSSGDESLWRSRD